MNGCIFGATWIYVTNGFIPGVVWAKPTPNDSFLPDPLVLHFLLHTSEACSAQFSAVFVPATPKNGRFPQPSLLHFLLWTLTIPLGA